jgi:hypothetical protein
MLLFAILQHPKVAGFQIRDRLALTIGHDNIDLDQVDIDADHRIRGCRLRSRHTCALCKRWVRRQPGQQQNDNESMKHVQSFKASTHRMVGSPCHRPRKSLTAGCLGWLLSN